MNGTKLLRTAATLALALGTSWAQSTTTPAESFPPFERWKAAVLSADAATLKPMYSTQPPAQIRIKTVMHDADADTTFWLALKPKAMTVDFVRLIVRPTIASVIFRTEITAADGKKMSLTDDQVWQKQADQWRLVAAERTDAPQLPQPADMKTSSSLSSNLPSVSISAGSTTVAPWCFIISRDCSMS